MKMTVKLACPLFSVFIKSASWKVSFMLLTGSVSLVVA